jgi:methenyltetrahydromethanopterin cyclohydrolase
MQLNRAWPSINQLTQPLLDNLRRDANVLRLKLQTLSNGATIVDAGIDTHGGLEAGRRIAEICMGGLGHVTLNTNGEKWPLCLGVHAANPVLACLGSQYAGWSLSHGEGNDAFHALGSGPGRVLARKEKLFEELSYRDTALATCLVLEVDTVPPLEVVEKVIRDCQVAAQQLILILTPTQSLAGVVQIVARVLEVALHKMHALGFPLDHIIDGAGSAPLPPPNADFMTSMGRTNDAILFGGRVQLFVDCSDDDARDLTQKLPSSASRDYGKLFGEIFKGASYDFYKIDPMLFAPAEVVVSTLKGGKTFRAGKVNEDLLDLSFS